MTSQSNDNARRPLYQRRWFWVAVAVAIAVLMRLPGVGVPVWNVDETFIAGNAAVTLDGGTPYLEWVDQRTPLTNLVYTLVFLVFGRYNMVAIHLALLAVVVTLILTVYHLGRRLVGRRGAAAAALLFAVVSSAGYPASDLFAFNTEWGAALSTALGMCLLVYGLNIRPCASVGAATGVALGAAVLFKQPAIFDLLAAAAVVLVIAWRPDRDLAIRSSGEALRYLAAMALGAAVMAGSLVAVVLWYGVWDDFVFYTITYNTEYYAAPFSFSGYLANASRAWLQAARPVGFGWLAAGGAVWILARMVRRPASGTKPMPSLQWLLVFWAIGSFLGVAASGRVFPHYFIQILVPWCLLAGLAVQELTTAMDVAVRSRLRPAAYWAVTIVALAVAALWFVVIPWQRVTPGRIEQEAGWVTDHATVRVAEYLRLVTKPDDTIFVWGFYPIPYVLADRLPASRFLYCIFMTGANVGGGASATERPVPGTMDDLLEDLERNRPAYIIDTSPGGYFRWGRYPLERYPRLRAFIDAEYRLDLGYLNTHGGGSFVLYERRPDL